MFYSINLSLRTPVLLRYCLQGCRYLEIVRNKISDTSSMACRSCASLHPQHTTAMDGGSVDYAGAIIDQYFLYIKKKASGCYLWPFYMNQCFVKNLMILQYTDNSRPASAYNAAKLKSLVCVFEYS